MTVWGQYWLDCSTEPERTDYFPTLTNKRFISLYKYCSDIYFAVGTKLKKLKPIMKVANFGPYIESTIVYSDTILSNNYM